VTLDEKKGQFDCLRQIGGALLHLERSVIITGIGAHEAQEIRHQLARLTSVTNRAKAKELAVGSSKLEVRRSETRTSNSQRPTSNVEQGC
jgi:hypothetical protein